MKDKLSIRKIKFEDIDFVSRVYESVLSPAYISFSEVAEGKGTPESLSDNAINIFRNQLIQLWQKPSHHFLVATLENEIVGFALSSINKTEAGHIECWLDDVGVSPKQQNQGIAQILINKIFDWGRNEGAKYFLLESGYKNDSAHNFFEHLGFQPLAVVFCLPMKEIK